MTTPNLPLTERVCSATAELVDELDFQEQQVADELARCRKMDLATYVTALANAINHLADFVTAATDQADQFTGSAEHIDQANAALGNAFAALEELAQSLS
jgi:DNA repair ATPase RecN